MSDKPRATLGASTTSRTLATTLRNQPQLGTIGRLSSTGTARTRTAIATGTVATDRSTSAAVTAATRDAVRGVDTSAGSLSDLTIDTGGSPIRGTGSATVLGGRIEDELFIKPDELDILIPNLPEVAPLALMPMRLEYRFVAKNAPPFVRDTGVLNQTLTRTRETLSGRSRKVQVQRAEAINKIRTEALTQSIDVKKLQIGPSEELWFRWYPDEAFAEEGIARPTDEEAAALAAFNQRIGTRNWWDLEDAEVSPAWQDFARDVGPARAVHLKRSENEEDDPNHQLRIGRIAALPRSVALFAVDGGQIDRLGEGSPIPENKKTERSEVSYTPEGIEAGGWLADFNVAIANGMGIKITDPKAIETAKRADWIVALGLHSGSASDEIEDLLKSHIANGVFGVLPQDSPTNNSPGQTSYHKDPTSDISGFTRRATADEHGDYSPDKRAAADLLAEAFDIDRMTVRKALDGADQGYEDARAMLRVIGPALLDDSLDGITQVNGVDENTFINVLAAAHVARGVLPAVRFGNNAYGVLPITNVLELESPDAGEVGEEQRNVHDFLRAFSFLSRAFLPGQADRTVPVIEPADPAASDKVEQILKTNRVSTRVDVADVGATTARAVTCPYVTGSAREAKPGRYLARLRTQPIVRLPDPVAQDLSWPLLYRLARLSLTRNTSLIVIGEVLGFGGNTSVGTVDLLTRGERQQVTTLQRQTQELSISAIAQGGKVDGASTKAVQQLRRINSDFANALSHLEGVAARPNGTAELEVLMLEVLDLLQHRADAFGTGLAYARLKRNRMNGQKGLSAGYFGFLGKLRPESATGASDGYIQAPSTPQAVTAAVLRSAHLRHRAEGAFDIDLSSRRVRHGLRLLDLLMKGHALSEALGLRGERWLHDNRHDELILPMRVRYPIRDQRGDGHAARRMFDGLIFLNASTGVGSPERTLQGILANELDALSDIVMAEATHQRAIGQAEAANAWLQVLAGHPPPGDPVFLRTQRHGQGSTHRVTTLLEAADPAPADNPRAIAEPSLAASAAAAMPGFAQAVVRLSATLVDTNAAAGHIDLSLGTDLDMAPIDLVVGGMSELQVRAKSVLTRRMIEDPALMTTLNAVGGIGGFASGKATLSVDLTVGTPSIESLIETAEVIRSAIQNGRPMEPGDLNAAADASHGLLTETDEIIISEHAIADLAERAQALGNRMQSGLETLNTTLNVFDTEMSEAALCIEANESDAVVAGCLARAEAARRPLADALMALAVFGEPSALRVFTLDDGLADREGLITRLREIHSRLAKRHQKLVLARDAQLTGFTTLVDAISRRNAISDALKAALDGDAMPILPICPRALEVVRPHVLGEASTNAALGGWATVRTGVARATALADAIPGSAAHPVDPISTDDDTDPNDAEPRPETQAPRTRHFGVFIGKRSTVTGSKAVTGIVCDEWAEQRPSETQMAAVAINYDSPQSEPPHCILLCVPPSPDWKAWSEERAAELVVEAIHWMKIRALSSDDRLSPAAMMPNANQVTYKNPKTDKGKRIPDRTVRGTLFEWMVGTATFAEAEVTNARRPAGLAAAGVTERTGYRLVKE